MTTNNADLVLNQQTFEDASRDLNLLENRIKVLRTRLFEMLNDLKVGFDTPAGRKLIGASEANLLKPLEEQAAVIQLMSKTLADVKKGYSEVFVEYDRLAKKINSIANK